MLLTYQHNQKQAADYPTLLLAIIRFQRGSRIIIITEIFATAFSLCRWSNKIHLKKISFLHQKNLKAKCKQL